MPLRISRQVQTNGDDMERSHPPTAPRRFAIIGGGISGLAAAQRVLERAPDAQISLFEASDRLGGLLQTTTEAGFVFEHSADNFICSDELPWAGELCQKIGLDTVGTSELHRGALILRGQRLYPVPQGLHLMLVYNPPALLRSPLLSLAGRIRAIGEPYVAPSTGEKDESLTEFATRRFGSEMFQRVVQPLVSGIYSADPDLLSMRAALPQFVGLERKHGSLRAAAKADQRGTPHDRGARYALFRTPRGGMHTLIQTLEHHLHAVNFRKSTPVVELRREAQHWWVKSTDTEEPFDRVIAATSASQFAKLAANVDARLSTTLDNIEHASTTVVCFGFERRQISHPLNAFGFVVPAVERRNILAASFTHVKFPARCREGQAIVRVFMGGALQPGMANLSDAESSKVALAEIIELLGVEGPPAAAEIFRWPQTTPQYNLGHDQQVSIIEHQVAAMDGLEFAGNAYHGIGVPQCVRSGWEAADRSLAVNDGSD